MSHLEQTEFISLVSAKVLPDLSESGRVLEIGSYDVNGSVRDLIEAAEYVGVDLVNGPGVDLVMSGAELELPDGSFDVALSCECFEHDPEWLQTFTNMFRMTKPGGVVVFTCATLGRMEHGTARTSPESSPGTQSRGIDYYRNLAPADFEDQLELATLFSDYRFFVDKRAHDLYFVGLKQGDATAHMNCDMDAFAADFALLTTSRHESMRDRLALAPVRVPLGLAERFLSENAYQNVAVRYLDLARHGREVARKLQRATKSLAISRGSGGDCGE